MYDSVPDCARTVSITYKQNKKTTWISERWGIGRALLSSWGKPEILCTRSKHIKYLKIGDLRPSADEHFTLYKHQLGLEFLPRVALTKHDILIALIALMARSFEDAKKEELAPDSWAGGKWDSHRRGCRLWIEKKKEAIATQTYHLMHYDYVRHQCMVLPGVPFI